MPLTAADARRNIEDVPRWSDPVAIVRLIASNPSLRGFVFGYLAEEMFEARVLHGTPGIEEITKDDDHKKTKADRSFRYKGRVYSIQNKSLQTNSIKDLPDGRIGAVIQNDASDRRKITFADGSTLETTCYQVGEYDILAVSLFPFTGNWKDFAYKRNRDLSRSAFARYTEAQRASLLKSLEPITWPLDSTWTTDLPGLLDDSLGRVAVPPAPVVPPTTLAEEVVDKIVHAKAVKKVVQK